MTLSRNNVWHCSHGVQFMAFLQFCRTVRSASSRSIYGIFSPLLLRRLWEMSAPEPGKYWQDWSVYLPQSTSLVVWSLGTEVGTRTFQGKEIFFPWKFVMYHMCYRSRSATWVWIWINLGQNPITIRVKTRVLDLASSLTWDYRLYHWQESSTCRVRGLVKVKGELK